MYAVRMHSLGGPLQLDEVDDPVPADGEVVVEVAYASVNPLDIWVSRGAPGTAGDHLPWVPGTEGTGHHDGRPVLLRGAGLGLVRRGTYQQKIAVPASALTDLPDDVDLAQVAGIGVAGITAYQSVHARARVAAGDRVLMLGASGGVSALVIQLAKAAGATVWGQTTSPGKIDFIRSIGADKVVVADAAGLGAAVAEFKPTVVIDPLGGPYTDAGVAALEPRGRLVIYGTSVDEVGTINLRGLYRKGIELLGYAGLIDTPKEQATVLRDLLDRVAGGSLTVPVEKVALADAAGVFDRILDRTVTGKLVIDLSAT